MFHIPIGPAKLTTPYETFPPTMHVCTRKEHVQLRFGIQKLRLF